MTKTVDTPKAGEPAQAAARPATTPAARATRQGHSSDPVVSNSGLDISGQFRIGDKISLSVRGGDLCLMKAHSGEEVIVSEASLQGLLIDEYFTKHAPAR